MKRGKAILILSPFFRPNVGGVETYLDDLCRYLTKHNYKVFVITYQPLTTKARGLRVEKRENLQIHRIPWFGHNLFHKVEAYPLLDFFYLTTGLFFFTFFFLLRHNNKIDVIHAQGLNAAFITKFLAKLFKKRLIMSTCAVYNLQKGTLLAKVVRWLLSDFDKILPLANFSKRELVHIGLPENKMNVYYLWVDQEVYKPKDKKESKERIHLAGKFIVLFIGRLIKIKGVEVLIEVARKVEKKINFVFIGDHGPLLKIVEEAASQSENIILVKNIHGNQLIPYYQAADILIVPSQYEEAFGKVIIESLSCGTPVIGANKGGIPEVLDPSVGILIEPTVKEIKEKIEFLFDNPQELKRLKNNCRKYALDRFSIKNVKVIEESYHS